MARLTKEAARGWRGDGVAVGRSEDDRVLAARSRGDVARWCAATRRRHLASRCNPTARRGHRAGGWRQRRDRVREREASQSVPRRGGRRGWAGRPPVPAVARARGRRGLGGARRLPRWASGPPPPAATPTYLAVPRAAAGEPGARRRTPGGMHLGWGRDRARNPVEAQDHLCWTLRRIGEPSLEFTGVAQTGTARVGRQSSRPAASHRPLTDQASNTSASPPRCGQPSRAPRSHTAAQPGAVRTASQRDRELGSREQRLRELPIICGTTSPAGRPTSGANLKRQQLTVPSVRSVRSSRPRIFPERMNRHDNDKVGK